MDPVASSPKTLRQTRARIDLHSDLTLENAFRFPLQCPQARRDLAIGGCLLWLPGLGFVLNMGYRLQMVQRLQNGETPWPGWDNLGSILGRGCVATIAIVVYHLPAIFCLLVAVFYRDPRWLASALLLGGSATFFLTGFMTFYAHDGDISHVVSPLRAWLRVLRGGRLYLRAWSIAVRACLLSFLGLLVFGLGFAWSSVWFWQVAAFCFSRVFSEQYGLRHR